METSIDTTLRRRLHKPKTMRKTLFSLLIMGTLMAGSGALQAQELHVWASTGLSTARNGSFLAFAKNFNHYVASEIDKPLDGLGIGTAYNVGATLDYFTDDFTLQLGIYTSNLAARTNVTYQAQESRVFELRRHLAGFDLHYGLRWERCAFYLGFGLQLGNTIIDSYFIYPDGTESHGRERPFNGIYQGLNMSRFFAAKFKLKLTDRLGLFAKLSYSSDFGKKGHLSDHNTSSGWTDGWVGSTMLPIKPADYIALLDKPNIPPYDGPWVMNKFSSIGLQIGIDFKLLNDREQ
jgi:hypothetical protein